MQKENNSDDDHKEVIKEISLYPNGFKVLNTRIVTNEEWQKAFAFSPHYNSANKKE